MLRFLVNPTAGGGRIRRRLPELERKARELGANLLVSCSGPDLTAQARYAVEQGVDRLVVAGGDGTLHLVAQALAETDCELAVLPSGRGDDFACSVGVPARFSAALELALSGRSSRVDLGRAGNRWFTIYAGSGFDSASSLTADRQPRWWPHSITYIVAVLRTLGGFRPPHARVEFDGGRFDGPVMFATACNAPRFGGGMRIAPSAEMSDGLLDLVIVEAVSKLELLKVFPRVFRGTHVGHPAISIHRTRSARLSFESTQVLGCDGELVGEVGREPIEIGLRANALRVVVP